MSAYYICLHLLQHVAPVSHTMFVIFVIKGDTECALAAWQTTSANPLPHQFLLSQQTAYVSWLQPSRHAFAALKQKMTPLDHYPQRDTQLEAPWSGKVAVSSPLSHKNKNIFSHLEVNSSLYLFSASEMVPVKTVDSNICGLSWVTGLFFWKHTRLLIFFFSFKGQFLML